MKDFLILCAKVALGIFIGFTLIFGGGGSLKGKADGMQIKANSIIDGISLTSSPSSSSSSDKDK